MIQGSILRKEDRQALFLDILKATHGNVSAACDMATITRKTYNVWLKEDWFAEQVEEIREYVLDVVEEVQMKNIVLGHSTKDIQFFLNAKGKSRGYGTGPKVEDPERRPMLASGSYPPEPKSLSDWQRQVKEAKEGTVHQGPPKLLPQTSGPDRHPDNSRRGEN